MLGRLRMSLEETETAYAEFSKTVFTPKRGSLDPRRVYDFLQASGKFESGPLEKYVKDVVRDHGFSEDELLKDTDRESCKVCVLAVRAEDGSPAVIRSYRNPKASDRLYNQCKIWEAARATSAASTFFEPITIGRYGQKYVDGALKYNNPIEIVDLEASTLWPNEDRLIISIGTGSAPGHAVDGNLIDLARRLAEIVTEAEEKNNMFRASHPKLVDENRLFRLNVYHGLESVGLEEHLALGRIAAYTDTYLNNPDVVRMVETCVKSMEGESQVSEGSLRSNLVTPDGLQPSR